MVFGRPARNNGILDSSVTALSVIIPARNEEFLSLTVSDLLRNLRGDTEIIVILDGAWANQPLAQHPRVKVVYHPQSIGQRAAINEGVRLSQAQFVMKVDAHCAFAEGFDVTLMERCEPNSVASRSRRLSLATGRSSCHCNARLRLCTARYLPD